MDKLTRDQILAMPAGRELDVLVGEIMNPEYAGELSDMTWFNPDGETTWHPAYSTDISAAWEVVGKMKRNNWSFILSDNLYPDKWEATFYFDDNQLGVSNTDEFAPLAICRAALLAVMGL